MKFWKNHLCFGCRQVVHAKIIDDIFVSEKSRLVKIKCPLCGFKETHIVDRATYNRSLETTTEITERR